MCGFGRRYRGSYRYHTHPPFSLLSSLRTCVGLLVGGMVAGTRALKTNESLEYIKSQIWQQKHWSGPPAGSFRSSKKKGLEYRLVMEQAVSVWWEERGIEKTKEYRVNHQDGSSVPRSLRLSPAPQSSPTRTVVALPRRGCVGAQLAIGAECLKSAEAGGSDDGHGASPLGTHLINSIRGIPDVGFRGRCRRAAVKGGTVPRIGRPTGPDDRVLCVGGGRRGRWEVSKAGRSTTFLRQI